MKILTALLFILSVSPVPGFACPSRNPTIDGAPFSTAGFEGKKLGYSEKFNTFTVKLVERVKDRDGCHSANIYEIYNANGQLISAISESTYIRKDESGTCRFVPPPRSRSISTTEPAPSGDEGKVWVGGCNSPLRAVRGPRNGTP